MKLIKKGRSQKQWSSEFTCTGKGNDGGGCGAILLVSVGDLFKQYHGCYDGSIVVDTYISFKCSECGVITDIWKSGEPSILTGDNFDSIPSKAPNGIRNRNENKK